MESFLQDVFLGNTVKDWFIAIGVFVGVYILVRVFEFLLVRYLKNLAKKTKTQVDDFLIEITHNSVVPMAYFGGIYLGMRYLSFSDKVYNVTHIALLVVFTYYILRIITSAIKFSVYNYLEKQEGSEVKKKQAKGILTIVNAVVWVLGFVFLLDNLGRDVTTIIAGLGVGGIAIALAAQTILGDLFSYFVIFFDQPFEIGDFIELDDKSGNVEYVGVKTTRIRTLKGDLLVVSNTDLTNSRIHNYKKLAERRVVFTLGFVYQTTHEDLKEIPSIIKSIIDSVEGTRFDRSHFSSYGDFSLNFETVYYVKSQDYSVYMDKQQEIYLAIFKAFEEKGIAFAYPTQTLFHTMEKGDKLNVQDIDSKD